MNNKTKVLLQKLIDKTNDKKIIWNEGTCNETFEYTSASIGRISINKYSYNNYRVDITTCIGGPSAIADEVYNGNCYSEDYKLLKCLFDAASNSFYKIDDVIDNMIIELDSIKII